MKTLVLLIAILAVTRAHAQTDTSLPLRTVRLVRPGQYVGALTKIRVEINGQIFPMSNASYALLRLRADSIVLKIENRRVSGESVQPLVSYKDSSYFVVFPEQHAHKKDRLILTEVEKDSYDKYADKVTRQVSPEP